MTQPLRVLAIPGALRRGSHNRQLLEAAAALAPEGLEIELFEGLRNVEPYDEDHEVAPGPGVTELRARIAAADALLIATPEYNGSIPGVLKNAVDWGSRPFGEHALLGKPVAVVSASTGQFGARWAQEELRKSLLIAGAQLAPGKFALERAASAFTEDGRLVDPDLEERLVAVLETLEAFVAEAMAEV